MAKFETQAESEDHAIVRIQSHLKGKGVVEDGLVPFTLEAKQITDESKS